MRAGLILIPMLAIACDPQPEPKPPPTPLVEQMAPVDPARAVPGQLLVGGMTCSGCEHNVSTALLLVDGVLEAKAEHASGSVQVRFDPARTSLAALAEAVREAGYAVTPVAGEER